MDLGYVTPAFPEWPDDAHCAFAEWQVAQTRLNAEEWLNQAECGRGFYGNATCLLCPYAREGLTAGVH